MVNPARPASWAASSAEQNSNKADSRMVREYSLDGQSKGPRRLISSPSTGMFPVRPGLLCLFAGMVAHAGTTPVADQAVSLLDSRCGQCHSEKAAMSGFRVSSREAL